MTQTTESDQRVSGLTSVKKYLESSLSNTSEKWQSYTEELFDREQVKSEFISNLKDLRVRLVGNRMVLASNILSSAGGAYTFTHDMSTWQEALAWLGVTAGLTLPSLLNVGEKTSSAYQRARSLIENHGRLSERYSAKILEDDSKLFGYCVTQGLYLAAKEYDQLDVFEEAKQNYSDNIFPNF